MQVIRELRALWPRWLLMCLRDEIAELDAHLVVTPAASRQFRALTRRLDEVYADPDRLRTRLLAKGLPAHAMTVDELQAIIVVAVVATVTGTLLGCLLGTGYA